MRLKCIRLAGFKSFVDPTTVNFPSNMAAVVGPNGCGKSNIIDAVRWVMGESSAKNLRGESMTDVIFNGSSGRKPVSQASIELVFDNSETTLVGEYAAYAEISIRRKVTRDGQNSYYLNLFARLLEAVVARDQPRIREVLTAYCQRSCELVLAALARI